MNTYVNIISERGITKGAVLLGGSYIENSGFANFCGRVNKVTIFMMFVLVKVGVIPYN